MPDNSLSLSTGIIVFKIWETLISNELVTKEQIITALVAGNLKEVFENSVLTFIINQKDTCSFISELLNRGFNSIVWDTSLQYHLRQTFIEKAIKIEEKSKKSVKKEISFEIIEDNIKVTYGWNAESEYFLSVCDDNLKFDPDADSGSNEIAKLVDPKQGKGCYISLYTGTKGTGIKVSLEAMAVYIHRYGASKHHSKLVKQGKPLE